MTVTGDNITTVEAEDRITDIMDITEDPGITVRSRVHLSASSIF